MGSAKTETILPVRPEPRVSDSAESTVTCFAAMFPCVHGSESGELVKLRCFVAPDLKATIKVTSPAIDENSARRVIGASRHDELDERAALGVIASVSNPGFSGASYELALAIADKMARYGGTSQFQAIIATGRIRQEGCGAVASVEHLCTKLRLVLKEAQTGKLFVFPKENLQCLTEIEHDLLLELRAKGVEWRAIDNIDELDGVLWQVTPIPAARPFAFRDRAASLRAAVFEHPLVPGLLVSILLVALFMLFRSPDPPAASYESVVSSESVTTVGESAPTVLAQPPVSPHPRGTDAGQPTEPAATVVPVPETRRLESPPIDTAVY